ncbi:hypothetical protein IWX90DRAFT_421044 [Phyllosticta citrichinensis]|uniref:Uncharacterized protein n=1 Tax=Phyllosticta citrichinensis TaxID=1130410 RepID=A0ABR1Y6C7_9PEZI
MGRDSRGFRGPTGEEKEGWVRCGEGRRWSKGQVCMYVGKGMEWKGGCGGRASYNDILKTRRRSSVPRASRRVPTLNHNRRECHALPLLLLPSLVIKRRRTRPSSSPPHAEQNSSLTNDKGAKRESNSAKAKELDTVGIEPTTFHILNVRKLLRSENHTPRPSTRA